MQRWAVTIEDADRQTVARRVFDSYDDASAAQDLLLTFEWSGFWAAPTLTPIDTPDN